MTNFTSLVKDLNYDGFKCEGMFRAIDSDSYELRFIKDDRYFYMSFSSQYIESIKNNPLEILKQIDKMVYSMPEFKKMKHHKEFYNKFDDMLKENE